MLDAMKHSRLLTLLMQLQTRGGHVSAHWLAAELGVSVRTVYRDVEALEASGIPIVVKHGAQGGFALLDGWRTRLTGMTVDEAQAMLLAGLPGPAEQLGLGNAVANAQLKLLAALPATWQGEAKRIAERFHLDPLDWYRDGARPHFLPEVAQAVFAGQRLAVTYESWKDVVERTLAPLGLVLKAGQWYLVAVLADEQRGAPRTYRVSNLRAVRPADGPCERPRGFDLARFWAESTARFERELQRGTARLRINATGLKLLAQIGSVQAQAVAGAGLALLDDDDWGELDLPIETVAHAARQLLRLGAHVEVLTPAELRTALRDHVIALAARYGMRCRD